MLADHCETAARAAMLFAPMRPIERLARLLLLAAWMALISYWSGQPNLPIDQPFVARVLHGFQHRLAHLVAFGLVGLLARWAFDGIPRATALAVLLTSAFGATDEWHQSFTPGRHSGIDDWAWDTACAAIALYAWSWLGATRWRTRLRVVAPLAVGAVFVVGIGLAVQPSLSLPSAVNRAGLTSVHTVIELARSTRDAARQFRSSVSG